MTLQNAFLSTRKALAAATGILLITASTMACGGSYGSLKSDERITRAFKNYDLPEGYTYYYYGYEIEPDVILGIKDGYTLQTKLWKPLTYSQDQLKRRIDRMRHKIRSTPWGGGAAIVTPSGTPIGIWYSRFQFTTVKITGPKTLMVYPPHDRYDHMFLEDRGVKADWER